MEDFLKVNPDLSKRIPNFLQFNDYMSMILAEITSKILLTCFALLPNKIRAKWNEGL